MVVRLDEAPIGLFMSMGELCVKTEYREPNGAVTAYIVSSGEFFWGPPPQTVATQNAAVVTPLQARIDECAPYLKQGQTPVERMRQDHADILYLMKSLKREKERAAMWPKHLLNLIERAREYVQDSLDAHEHNDGRDLLNEIDEALKPDAEYCFTKTTQCATARRTGRTQGGTAMTWNNDMSAAPRDEDVCECGAWICSPCGHKLGTRVPTSATFHMGKCDYCGNDAAVTEPRDYGHPPLKDSRND